MLHSFHYYACYYALICLLHQQQQAASLTIIIDGATTNEWATRDEYQRLVGGANLNPEVGATRNEPQPQHQQQQHHHDQQQQHNQQAGFDLTGTGGDGAGGAASRPLNSEQLSPSPIISASSSSLLTSNNNNGDQQQQQALSSLSLSSSSSSSFEPLLAGDLETALERLDLIEEQRKQLLLRQRQLQQLELQQRLNIQQQISPLTNINPSTNNNILGARTINDLVPIGDDREDFDDPLRRLKERGSSRQKYCGRELMDVLELVCQGRYYAGESEPQIVNPTIKSKRFIDSDASFTGSKFAGNNKIMLHELQLADQHDIADLQQQQPPVSRRRKLRTLELPLNAPNTMEQNDGVNVNHVNTNINNNDNINNIDENINNMNNRYLSSSRNIIENNNNINNNKHIDATIDNDNIKTDIPNTNTNIDNNNNINEFNNNNKQQLTNLNDNNSRNRHSKMALYRRIRGANAECCRRACYIEELRPYCKP